MSVRLTEDARMIIAAALEWGFAVDREGFNAVCRRNPLMGSPDGKAVAVAVRAVERVGVANAIALAHADIDFRHEDFYDEEDEG